MVELQNEFIPSDKLLYTRALQPVCTVHTRVHQKMLGVHHYERVHKGAPQTCRLRRTLFKKLCK